MKTGCFTNILGITPPLFTTLNLEMCHNTITKMIWKKWCRIHRSPESGLSGLALLDHLSHSPFWPSRQTMDLLLINSCLPFLWASLVTQTVKNPLHVGESWVRSLGWKDPLEKGMATYSSRTAWRIPWTEEPGRLRSTWLHRVRHDWAIFTFIFPDVNLLRL